ncbi:hypothetical protein Nepgr_015865 [Nepenthes gracilis]|uniref:Transmembrane protein n=1 Tax=Nepenthes gracilis TaxID=150966 RepID=A0AAD3XRH9_NEPGR|nr:hypothetical protein Nepgr_015865 [Nepenthes gracilis]
MGCCFQSGSVWYGLCHASNVVCCIPVMIVFLLGDAAVWHVRAIAVAANWELILLLVEVDGCGWLHVPTSSGESFTLLLISLLSYCLAADFSMLVPVLKFLVVVSSSVAVEDDRKVLLKRPMVG